VYIISDSTVVVCADSSISCCMLAWSSLGVYGITRGRTGNVKHAKQKDADGKARRGFLLRQKIDRINSSDTSLNCTNCFVPAHAVVDS